MRQVRIALLLGVIMYGLFGILDVWMAPEAKYRLWLIRYTVLVPYALSTFFFSFTGFFRKHAQLAVSSAVLVAGLGVVAMIVIAPPPANQSYYIGLIPVIIYGYTFLRLRFIWATISGLTIVLAFEIATVWLTDTPILTLINNNFFFLTSNMLGMFASYSMEYYLRKDYVHAHLLDSEKKKVMEANIDLEKRVEDRTAELVETNVELKKEMAERNRAEEEQRYLESQLQKSQKMEAIGTLAGGGCPRSQQRPVRCDQLPGFDPA
jgi:hypothetical protein